MKSFPNTLWAAGYHKTLGLYQPKPIKLEYDPQDQLWYDSKKKFVIEKPGLDQHPDYTDFSSPNKKDVQNWVLGIKSTKL
jgi:hypothetical protein